MKRQSRAPRVFTISRVVLAFLAVAAAPGVRASAQQIAGNLYVSRSTVWPSRSIEVCWETRGYDANKQLVRNAVERTWEKESAVDFTGWEQCATGQVVILGSRPLTLSSGLRIRIADENPRTQGLGRRLMGLPEGMVLNFTFAAWKCGYTFEQCVTTIAVHEFGHALGFSHEQNRRDTPPWCSQPHQGEDGDTTIGHWDENSIMNYCHDGYSTFGALSAGDIEAVRQVYGAPLPPVDVVSKLMVGACVGQGGVQGLTFWGPTNVYCNNIVAWGRFDMFPRAAQTFGSCVGRDGVNGVRLYGPTGEMCAGVRSWGTYQGSIDVSGGVCGCVGRGNILSGMVLWGPRNASCGGFADWGVYGKSCVEGPLKQMTAIAGAEFDMPPQRSSRYTSDWLRTGFWSPLSDRRRK